MSKPGPAPIPTHLKILKGDRKDRINFNEPKPKKQKPQCPSWLSDEAKIIWRKTTKQLEAMNMLYSADTDIIVAYVNAVVNYQRSTKIVDSEGILIEGRRDGVVTNPAVRIQRDSANLIRQLASELGLTPSGRSRLNSTEEGLDENDILD